MVSRVVVEQVDNGSLGDAGPIKPYEFVPTLETIGETMNFSAISGLCSFPSMPERRQYSIENNATLTDYPTARVLIVDDEPDGAMPLALLLKLRGYLVEIVTDSQLCLPRLETFKPDVVLLDIAMPRISGYDLAQQIRSNPGYAGTAIIALSGYADPSHTQQSLEAGCDQHLVKPIMFEKLAGVITHEVTKHRQINR